MSQPIFSRRRPLSPLILQKQVRGPAGLACIVRHECKIICQCNRCTLQIIRSNGCSSHCKCGVNASANLRRDIIKRQTEKRQGKLFQKCKVMIDLLPNNLFQPLPPSSVILLISGASAKKARRSRPEDAPHPLLGRGAHPRVAVSLPCRPRALR